MKKNKRKASEPKIQVPWVILIFAAPFFLLVTAIMLMSDFLDRMDFLVHKLRLKLKKTSKHNSI